MNPNSLPLIILLILPLFEIPACFSQDDSSYLNCRDQRFHCGNITNISYPFSGGDRPGYCGRPDYKLNCNDDDNITQVDIQSVTYRVLYMNPSERVVRLSRDDLWSDLCPQDMSDTSLPPNLFSFYSPADFQRVGLYYGCSVDRSRVEPSTIPGRFGCNESDTTSWNFYQYPYLESSDLGYGIACDKISVYVNSSIASALMSFPARNTSILQEGLRYGFWVQWAADDENCSRCEQTDGMCGSDSNKFVCYCRNGTTDSICTRGGSKKSNVGMSIGLSIAGAVVAGFGLAFLIVCCRRRKKQRHIPLAVQTSTPVSKDISTPPPLSSTPPSTASSKFTTSIPSYPTSNSDLGRGSSYFGAQVFDYAELEQATDNFNPTKELGEGGFGTVYYGELPDGRLIAVKRLFENNYRRAEQFMNEVEILTKLRHPNLVTLHGCTSRRSRELLLVYEYIPNGTVADHVHGKRSNSGLLSWPVRLNIAIETAEALAYLHKSAIIHRDVKTNNVLLDNDFHVKVADFGLSRLFPTDVTHVSTAPQGTPGYVDPEYYQCYQLTEKSDVYSFGVVLIELISSLMAVDTSRHRHDINLSNMAVTKIQNHALHEIVDPSLGFETNSAVRRRITLVAELAFRCLQQERDMRPSMAEVLECMKRIRDDNSANGDMVEVVDILVDEDETGPLKNGFVPPPPPPEA